MIIYDWPADLRPTDMEFWLQPHVGGSESPITRTRKTYGLSKPRWVAAMNFSGNWIGGRGISGRGARLDAFIAQLQGGLNLVRLWDFRRPYPLTLKDYYSQFAGELYTFGGGETFGLGEKFFIPAEAEPMNETAEAGASEMTFSGFVPGDPIFSIGDYVGGDDRPHIITNDADADEYGQATIEFQPPLATAILAGTSVTMQPTGLFQLTSGDAGKNTSRSRPQRSQHSLSFVEFLP